MRRLIVPTLLAGILLAQSSIAETTCESRLTFINPTLQLFTDEQIDHTTYIRQLEASIDRQTRSSNQPLRPTQIRGSVKFETALFFLAGGKSEQLVGLIRTPANNLDSAYHDLIELAKRIEPLHKTDVFALTDEQARQLVELEVQFMVASQQFGEDYGFVKNMIELLQSVAAGQGVPAMALFPTHTFTSEQKPRVVLDLTTPRAKEAAARTLNIIKSNGLPEVQKIREMFLNNKYALRAKLERDEAELKSMNRIWRKAANAVAQALMTTTEKIPYLPEKVRVLLMRAAGMQVKQFMFNFYLGRIQDIISVTRVRTDDGKIALLNDEPMISEQILELNEAAASGIGEDLLITFARLPYHRESWLNLLTEVEKRAKVDGPAGQEAKHLLARMTAARDAARKLGDVPYVHEPAKGQELQLLVAQGAYLLITEEATRHWLWPFLQNFLQ